MLSEDQPTFRPAVARYIELKRSKPKDIKCAFSDDIRGVQLFSELKKKYQGEFAERTGNVLKLSPDLHARIGSGITNAILRRNRANYTDIANLDEVIAEISDAVEKEVRERLEAANLWESERQGFAGISSVLQPVGRFVVSVFSKLARQKRDS